MRLVSKCGNQNPPAAARSQSRLGSLQQLLFVLLAASLCLYSREMSRAYDDAAQSAQASPTQVPAAPPQAASGAAAQPAAPPAQDPNSLQGAAENAQPAFYVHAELDRPTKDFREGDALTLRVTCEIDAYLYILYQQADGETFQIFPNKVQTNNRVAAKETVQVPAKDDLFRWVIGPPFGKEIIKVIAGRKPIDDLSRKELRAGRFNPISLARVKGVGQQLAKGAASDWAEVDLEILTYAKSQAPLAQGSKRFGVFFGVSHYQFDSQRRAAVERLTGKNDEGGLNLNACDRDAKALGGMLQEIGALNDLRVYTDADASRANLEYAVTRWLPSVSRPGDTVFIHFSGHGSQVADDNGDEVNDHLDEVLIPYDMVDDLILSQFLEEAKENKLDPKLAPRVQELLEVARRGGDRAREMLLRETGVSDDLFGRWLQHLSGRQVVVILDTCHSGGFATQEKGLKGANKADADAFDFLEGEMARLKDIGERDQAMLAAAMSAESALELINKENGVLTGFLLESLRMTQGPVRLENGYQYCEEQFPKYFELINEELAKAGREERLKPHHPLLVNYCARPVYLKP